MNPYDLYSKVYDEVEGLPQGRIKVVKELISKYHKDAESLLEIACGTGNIIQGLSDLYEVSGLDISEAMLQKARVKLPNSQFYLADMTDFKLNKKFDVIICIYDSINHLLSFDQWKKVFKTVKEHLNPRGIFIFDMNTVGKLEEFGNRNGEAIISKSLGNDLFSMSTFRDAAGIINFEITLSQKKEDGHSELHTEVIKEKSFKISQVQESLTKYFKVLAVVNSDMRPAQDQGRVYFVAQNEV